MRRLQADSADRPPPVRETSLQLPGRGTSAASPSPDLLRRVGLDGGVDLVHQGDGLDDPLRDGLRAIRRQWFRLGS